jgi:hypothetical protein
MSNELAWLDRIGSIDRGIELINRVGWNIIVGESNGRWYVQSGEKIILVASSRRAVDTFLYGMALAYSVLPEPIIEKLREEFGVDEDH